MKFPKFPKFYNPFRVIRELKGMAEQRQQRNKRLALVNERQRYQISELQANIVQLGTSWHKLFLQVVGDLSVHEQAVEAFMVEREELKANIALRDKLGISLVGSLVEASQEVEKLRSMVASYAEALQDAEASDQAQTVETARIVDYVKQCETSLAAAGITIADAAEGPAVVVDQEAFLSAARSGTIKVPEAA